MARRPVPDDLIAEWTTPPSAPRRSAATCANSPAHLANGAAVAATQKLADFTGPALVLWSPETDVMRPEHGAELATLISAVAAVVCLHGHRSDRVGDFGSALECSQRPGIVVRA
jgi:hypothetical protein